MNINHQSAGTDIYRPFFVEAAKRTMLSSIEIVIIDRGNDCSYSGSTLADFFESVSGIIDTNDSVEIKVNKLPCNADVTTTDIARNIAPSKDIVETRSGRPLELSIRDHTGVSIGYDLAEKLPWSVITRMLDTNPNLRSLKLYNFIFIGDSVRSSSYPTMRQVRVDFDCSKEKDFSPFLSLFPNLEYLSFVASQMSVERTLALLRQRCPLLSVLALRLRNIDEAEHPKIAMFANEFQHSMPHLKRLVISGNYKYRWVRPKDTFT